MDSSARLTQCFLAVFPRLAPDRVATATPENVEGWDSVAHVTLLAAVEEEFGVTLDVEHLDQLNSYASILRQVHAQ